jgi:hypothetical protein
LSFLKSVVLYSASRLFITNFKIQNQRFVICLLIFAICILHLPCAAIAGTATATIAWDPSSSAVAGYDFFYGTSSGNYDYVVDVGKNTSCSISGLENGITYYFVVKAYDSIGLESEFSEELRYTVPLTTVSVATTTFDNPDPDFIDNSDSGFETIGTWISSTRVSGFYGTNYQYARKGNGKHSASWTYNINTQGEYEIYAQWTSHSNRASHAPYSIYNNGIFIDTVQVDQRVNGDQLNLLGTFALSSGTLEIVLTNDESGAVIADVTQIVFLN